MSTIIRLDWLLLIGAFLLPVHTQSADCSAADSSCTQYDVIPSAGGALLQRLTKREQTASKTIQKRHVAVKQFSDTIALMDGQGLPPGAKELFDEKLCKLKPKAKTNDAENDAEGRSSANADSNQVSSESDDAEDDTEGRPSSSADSNQANSESDNAEDDAEGKSSSSADSNQANSESGDADNDTEGRSSSSVDSNLRNSEIDDAEDDTEGRSSTSADSNQANSESDDEENDTEGNSSASADSNQGNSKSDDAEDDTEARSSPNADSNQANSESDNAEDDTEGTSSPSADSNQVKSESDDTEDDTESTSSPSADSDDTENDAVVNQAEDSSFSESGSSAEHRSAQLVEATKVRSASHNLPSDHSQAQKMNAGSRTGIAGDSQIAGDLNTKILSPVEVASHTSNGHQAGRLQAKTKRRPKLSRGTAAKSQSAHGVAKSLLATQSRVASEKRSKILQPTQTFDRSMLEGSDTDSPGMHASLDESGFEKVSKLNDDEEMKVYVSRLAESCDMKVINNGGLNGVVGWLNGGDGEKVSLDDLKESLFSALLAASKDHWVAVKNSTKVTGSSAPLDLVGFVQVRSLRSAKHMIKYVRRMVENMGIQIVDNGGFEGMMRFYSEPDDSESFQRLIAEIKKATYMHSWAELQ